MSLPVAAWVWEHSKLETKSRFLLVTLAAVADDEGFGAMPGGGELAQATGMSRRSVGRYLEELEQANVLRRDGDEFTVVGPFNRDVQASLFDAPVCPPSLSLESADLQGRGALSQTSRGHSGVMLLRDIGPIEDLQSEGLAAGLFDRIRGRLGGSVAPLVRRAGRAPVVVNGVKVTGAEERFALAVLEMFNELAGRRFSAKEVLAKIILRHREHPELDLDAHRKLVEEQLAHPWWEGDASPSVIMATGTCSTGR
jgi:hypothetical protein